VEKSFRNLTATKLPVSVLDLVPPTLNALELKEPTVWPTEFASTADPTLTVPLETLGMVMVVKSQDKPSVTLLLVSVLPLVTEISDPARPTLVQPPLLIVTLLVSVPTVSMMPTVLPKMVLQALPTRTPSVTLLPKSALIHSTVVLVLHLPITLVVNLPILAKVNKIVKLMDLV